MESEIKRRKKERWKEKNIGKAKDQNKKETTKEK